MKNDRGIEILEHAYPINWEGTVSEDLQRLLDDYEVKFNEFADCCEDVPYYAMDHDNFCEMLRICIRDNIKLYDLWEKEIGEL